MFTSRLYYDITKGRKRMLSKTEVLGRLYYCGFAVDEIVPMGHIEYVFAHRHSQPYPQEQFKVYGPLIKLPRVCKNKEIRYFYKMRTMHPYAEYIQKYVFDARGGMDIADKSNDDWRITNWGKFMRKYWLDELPMLFNWLKGDVKLVGVRPLSKTMFETYPKWLQDKRTLTRPGLIPPFYIDHPKTFDELFASEDKYLTEYLKNPIRRAEAAVLRGFSAAVDALQHNQFSLVHAFFLPLSFIAARSMPGRRIICCGSIWCKEPARWSFLPSWRKTIYLRKRRCR